MNSFACLGLTWLGMCAYNPSNPPQTYFTLGDAIAAIAVTLALQSFMKPVYRLRLAARFLSLQRLYMLIFAGVGITTIAALVPNLPFLGDGPWRYPILWELFAMVLFVIAYGAVAITVVRPVKVRPRQMERFARVVANILAQATETDHIDLLPDIELSLPVLMKLATFVEYRRVEFSAFELFTHRDKIKQASWARSLLEILADPLFCQSLIRRAPWTVAGMIGKISDDKLHCGAAEQFIQELAHQAILLDEGIMSREVSYQGFGTAPVLSDALFADGFIVDRYDPLETYFRSEEITHSVLRRFNAAAERCFLTMIKPKHVTYSYVGNSIGRFYETASMRAGTLQDQGDFDFQYVMEFGHAVETAIKIANKMMSVMSAQSYEQLFFKTTDEHRLRDPIEPLIEIVFNAMQNISNSFRGHSDRFWHVAIEVLHSAYHSIGTEPDGMTPFQQRLTIKIIDKLGDNMNGFYPAICRVLLATVGPYDRKAHQPNQTAFNILRDAMYVELRKFPNLAQDKFGEYLPDNVSYDAEKKTLTHTYFGGSQDVTDLTTLKLEPVDLCDPNLHRGLSEDERKQAATKF